MAEFMAFSALGLSEVARRGGAERQAPFELRVDHRTVPEKLFGATPSAVDDYSVTSSMRDAQATNSMTVKSGYEGHVPLGRDLIGGSYRTAVNRGVPGQEPYIATRTMLPPSFHQNRCIQSFLSH